MISNDDADTVRMKSITVSGEEGELCSSLYGCQHLSTSHGLKERAGRRLHITYETAEFEEIDERGQLLTVEQHHNRLFRIQKK